ncbi:hypothetical protein [Geobacter sp. AOG1]|uniref:hypothetical protein n=1 Tax=Geobacter sp. AOG1 TaxID=1566346 RepID=UPI001CC76539|nr:hypothetical protein [Geobacter sp. AOG1]GFE57682.1 hypothetical protein AOG1_15620 [Geobacter sp. AOG1]
MRVIWAFMISLCIYCNMLVSPAIAADPVSEGLAERVLAASQLIEHLSTYKDAYQAVANTSLVTKNDEGEQSRMLLALKESFDIGAIRGVLLQTLISRYDQLTLKRLAEFLERPVVAAMMREERRIEEPGVQGEMCQYLTDIRDTPPPAKRIELLNAIEAALHGAETEADTIIMLSESMTKSLEPFLAKEVLAQRQDAVRRMKENRDALVADSRPELMLNYHFIYRLADDAQLREYIDLLRTEIGRTYVAFASSTVPLALAESERRAAEKIAGIVKQRETSNKCIDSDAANSAAQVAH